MAEHGRVPLHVGAQALDPRGLRSPFPSCVNGTSPLTSLPLGFLFHKMKTGTLPPYSVVMKMQRARTKCSEQHSVTASSQEMPAIIITILSSPSSPDAKAMRL